MSEFINNSMVSIAKARALILAKEMQVDGVVVLIWHSGDQLAVGHSIACPKENESNELAALLRDALAGCEAAPVKRLTAIVDGPVDSEALREIAREAMQFENRQMVPARIVDGRESK